MTAKTKTTIPLGGPYNGNPSACVKALYEGSTDPVELTVEEELDFLCWLAEQGTTNRVLLGLKKEKAEKAEGAAQEQLSDPEPEEPLDEHEQTSEQLSEKKSTKGTGSKKINKAKQADLILRLLTKAFDEQGTHSNTLATGRLSPWVRGIVPQGYKDSTREGEFLVQPEEGEFVDFRENSADIGLIKVFLSPLIIKFRDGSQAQTRLLDCIASGRQHLAEIVEAFKVRCHLATLDLPSKKPSSITATAREKQVLFPKDWRTSQEYVCFVPTTSAYQGIFLQNALHAAEQKLKDLLVTKSPSTGSSTSADADAGVEAKLEADDGAEAKKEDQKVTLLAKLNAREISYQNPGNLSVMASVGARFGGSGGKQYRPLVRVYDSNFDYLKRKGIFGVLVDFFPTVSSLARGIKHLSYTDAKKYNQAAAALGNQLSTGVRDFLRENLKYADKQAYLEEACKEKSAIEAEKIKSALDKNLSKIDFELLRNYKTYSINAITYRLKHLRIVDKWLSRVLELDEPALTSFWEGFEHGLHFGATESYKDLIQELKSESEEAKAPSERKPLSAKKVADDGRELFNRVVISFSADDVDLGSYNLTQGLPSLTGIYGFLHNLIERFSGKKFHIESFFPVFHDVQLYSHRDRISFTTRGIETRNRSTYSFAAAATLKEDCGKGGQSFVYEIKGSVRLSLVVKLDEDSSGDFADHSDFVNLSKRLAGLRFCGGAINSKEVKVTGSIDDVPFGWVMKKVGKLPENFARDCFFNHWRSFHPTHKPEKAPQKGIVATGYVALAEESFVSQRNAENYPSWRAQSIYQGFELEPLHKGQLIATAGNAPENTSWAVAPSTYPGVWRLV